MITTEFQASLQEVSSNRHAHNVARVAIASSLDIGHNQANLFAHIAEGPELTLPTNYLTDETGIVTPSLEVVSALKGNKATIVDLHGTDRTLDALYNETIRAAKGLKDRVTGMLFETIVRILDTNGAQGLHHVHDTAFPRTVYQVVKRGSGIVPNIYVTQVAIREDQSPVFALLTATRDKQAEYKLFRAIGAGSQKKKRSA